MSAAEVSDILTRAVQAHERGDLEAAQAGYNEVLQHVPGQPDALHLLGVIADQQGRHQEAVELIGRAIAAAPGAATFHGNLGTALLALGKTGKAEAAYREGLRLDPAYLDGQLNLASLLLQAKRADEALPHLTAAIRIDPVSARARHLSGVALGLSQRHAEAVAQHRQAVMRAPDDIGYRESLANALVKSGDPDFLGEAVREFQTVLERQPQRFESLMGAGSALVKSQNPLAAMPYFEKALAIDSGRIEPLINYAVTLAYAGRFDEALDYCERAMELATDACLVFVYRGTVREYAGDFAGALSDYAAAQQTGGDCDPAILAEARLKQGLLLLAHGRQAEGWPLYRARFSARSTQAAVKAFETTLPRWDGTIRPSQRILIWGEQGIGDQVIYASMLPELLARGAELVLSCDPRLIPLFARSFPSLSLLPLQYDEAGRGSVSCYVQIGLGDLGSILRPSLSAFPPGAAYLKPDAERVAALRAKYAAHRKRLIVGLTWRSKAATGAYKSARLTDWAPVLRQEEVLFVDLQYGDTAEERSEAREQLGVDILHDDGIDPLKDLDGFAAQAAAVDLVIGGSNSGQHIAAAVGRPCWIAVPGGAGRLWYWFLGREDSPWYPQVRLFRQKPGRYTDWAEPIGDMAEALQQYMSRL